MPDFPAKIQKNSPNFTENPLDALKQLCYNYKLRRDFSANFALRIKTPETAAKGRNIRPLQNAGPAAAAALPAAEKKVLPE